MNRAKPPAPKQGFLLKILSLIEVCLLGVIGLILGALLFIVVYACEGIKHIAEKKSRRKTQHLAEEIRQRVKAQQKRKREETSLPPPSNRSTTTALRPPNRQHFPQSTSEFNKHPSKPPRKRNMQTPRGPHILENRGGAMAQAL